MTTEVAVFGAGRIGKIHAANLAQLPGVRLKYIVDVDAQAAAALARSHGAKVADAEGALGDASIAATVVCSSTDTHAELIIKSAAQKKHVFCEKPVDLTLERARACADAVARAEIICMIGFQRRFDPTFSALKARVAAGEIGDPEMLVITSRDPGAPRDRIHQAFGGHIQGHADPRFRCLPLDARPTRPTPCTRPVAALRIPRLRRAGDIDSTAVTIRTKRGRLCQINTARRAAYGYDQRFELLGSIGMLQTGNVRPTQVTAYSRTAVSSDVPEAFFLERYLGPRMDSKSRISSRNRAKASCTYDGRGMDEGLEPPRRRRGLREGTHRSTPGAA